MHVAIIGATGLVGRKIVDRLLDDQNVKKITVITRRSLSIDNKKYNETLIKDFTQDSIYKLKISADSFICCLGSTIKDAGSQAKFREIDVNYVVAFAKLAEKMGAHSLFVVSALGANLESMFFYNRVKGEMENLVTKAVRKFEERTGREGRYRVRLEKRIPAGAGLGGGSSDAAAMLRALDEMGGVSLEQADLEAIAAELGSDVPFFLRRGACWCRGRGELLEDADHGLLEVLQGGAAHPLVD